MTEAHFKQEIRRLINAYPKEGADAYNAERCKIIFDSFRDLSDGAFTRVVTQAIGANLRPPMVDKFREAAAVEREYAEQREKQQRRRVTLDTLTSDGLPNEEVRTIAEMIKRRAAGGYTDEDWAKIQMLINQTCLREGA